MAAVLGSYAPVLRAPFIFEDLPAIVGNAGLRQGAWFAALHPPAGETAVLARPVLSATLAGNYALGGLHVAGYHAVNLLIHAAAALALFGAVRRTARTGAAFAWACALLWAVHPLQTDAVSYTVQRGESLMGCLCLFSLYGFIRAAGEQAAGRSGLPWFGLSWLACLLGMGTHQVMVSAPFILLIYDRTFLCASWREVLRRRWPWHTLYLASLAWLFYLAAQSQNRAGTYGFGVMPWLKYAAAEFPAFAHYLRLVVWPTGLVVEYGNRYVTSGWQVLPGLGWLAAFTAVALSTFHRPTPMSFLAIFLLEILEPTSIVPSLQRTTAEHRMYLPLAALIVGLVWLLQAGLAWRGDRRITLASALRSEHPLRPRQRAVFGVIVAAVALALGAVTFARNRDYLSGDPVRLQGGPASASASAGGAGNRS